MSNSANSDKYLGRHGQLGVYVGKFLRLFFAEKQWMMLVMSGIIAFLVSTVVGRNIYRTMEGTLLGGLAIACVCLWNGVFNSIQVICKERSIIKREHRSGLSITSYLGSHMLVQLIICMLQVIIMMLVLKFTNVKFPSQGLIFPWFVVDYYISLLLMTYASDMLGLMVSCIVKNTTMAMTVMPFVLIVQLLFANVAFPLSGPAAKAADFTITKWGVAAVCIEGDYNNQPSVSLYNAAKSAANKDELAAELFKQIDGVKFTMMMGQYSGKSEYDFIPENLLRVWGMLGIFIVIFAVVGFTFLKFIDKDKRS